MRLRLSLLTAAVLLGGAASSDAATVSMATRTESGPKPPDYQVPITVITGDTRAEQVALVSPTRARGDVTAGTGCTQTAPDQVDCSPTTAVTVDLGAGDDRFTAADGVPRLVVDGRAGADVLDTGAAALDGGDGDDVLRVTGAGASLEGGPGADRLEAVAPAGGRGASLSWAEEGPVAVDLRAGVARTPTGTDVVVADVASVTLGEFGDRLQLTDRGVSAYANGGNDLVVGGAGKDFVNGGDGADTITTGAGDDEVLAGTGADGVSGGPGDDVLFGGQYLTEAGGPRDRLSGGDGDDGLFGRGRLDGGAGDDRLTMGGDGGRTLDRRGRARCGTGDDLVNAPGAYLPVSLDCERIGGVHADGSRVELRPIATGGVRLQVRGRTCRRRATAGGRSFVMPRPARIWRPVLLRRPPLRPTLVSLTRCDTKRVIALATLVR